MSIEKENSKWEFILKECIPYIITILLVILVKKFIVSPIKVNGDSMNDTLQDGDIMILDIVGYRFSKIKRFDIVVVDRGKEYIIKRVIGLPGETIEYKDNELYVDGKKIEDQYGSDRTEDFTVKVPKDSYFVLGDNRTNSLDSRYFGPFRRNKILGRTSLTLYPFDRIGTKK